VVNCFGDVVDDDGTVLAGARDLGGNWLVNSKPWRYFAEMPATNLITNTTLVVVMTNALLDKVGVNRIAQRVHDGLAIAIRPIHTSHDGDVAFALSTGKVAAPFDLVGNVAVSTVIQAIQNGVRFAKTAAQVPGLAG
jgi:L-aminopeptidase/D-esterase-like protein